MTTKPLWTAPDSLVVLGLFGTLPGYEINVIEQVAGVTTHEPPPGQRSPRWNETRSSSFGLFGRFDVATIFETRSFDVSSRLSELLNIRSHQCIVGQLTRLLPSPASPTVVLHQDAEMFWSRVHNSTWGPLIGICQLQVSGIVSTSFGSHVLHPFLWALNSLAARHNANAKNLRVAFIDSLGWGNWTLFVGSTSYEAIIQFIHDVRSISISSLEHEWNEHLRDALAVSSSQFSDSSYDRLARFFECLEIDSDYKKSSLFSTSFSVLGCSIEAVKDIIDNASTHGISGSVRSITQLSIKPGLEKYAISILREAGVKIPHRSKYRYTIGRSDISFTSKEISTPTFLLRKLLRVAHVKTVELIKIIFRIRWELLNEKRLGPNSKGRLLQIDGSQTYIESFVDNKATTNELLPVYARYREKMDKFSEEHRYHAMFYRKLRRILPRNIVNRLGTVYMQWRNELYDYHLSSQMIEIAGAVKAAFSVLRFGRLNKAEMALFVEDVSDNINRALLHRIKASYHTCENSDYSNEFDGGLSRLLSTVDGFIKCALSLVIDRILVGAITLVGHSSSAEVSTQIVSTKAACKYDKILFTVIKLNWTHLVHPLKLKTVMHELGHVIIQSEKVSADSYARKPHYIDEDERIVYERRFEEIEAEMLLRMLAYHDSEVYSTVSLPYAFCPTYVRGHSHEINEMLSIEQCLVICAVEFAAQCDSPERCCRERFTVFSNDWVHRNIYYIYIGIEFDDDVARGWIVKFMHAVGAFACKQGSLVELYSIKSVVAGILRRAWKPVDEEVGIDTSIEEFLAQYGAEIRFYIREGGCRLTYPELSSFFVGRREKYSREVGLRVCRLLALRDAMAFIRIFFEETSRIISDGSSAKYIYSRKRERVYFDPQYEGLRFKDQALKKEYFVARMSVMKYLWHIGELIKSEEILPMLGDR